MKSYYFLILLFLGLLPTVAHADCFPIRRIMDPSSRADFRNLCRAAVSCDPACQNIEPSKLINCSTTQDANKLLSGNNIGRRLLGCARAFFVDSMVDLANTVIELIKTLVGASVDSFVNIYKFMTDADFRANAMRRATGMSAAGTAFLNSAVRNFSTEYERNYNAARARGVSLLNAPLAALGPTFMEPFLKMVVDAVSQIAESQISQFKCLNGEAKLESLCAMAGGFIMPPAVLFQVIKNGARAISTIRGVDTYMTAARRSFAATTRRAPTPTLVVGAPPRPTRPPTPVVGRTTAAPRRDPTPASARPRTRRNTPGEAEVTDAPIVNAAENITEGAGNTADATQIVTEVVEQTGDDMIKTGDDMAGTRQRTVATPDELRLAGALDDTSRVAAAETAFGRTLTEAEQSAILDAHYVGIKGPDGQFLPEAERRGFGTYNYTDIRQKRLILAQAGFSPAEIRICMDRGICGAPAGLAGTAGDVAVATARREAILAANGDGLRPGIANERIRTVEVSRDMYELEIESVVATRGNLTIARESTGAAAQDASRRAIETATTSGDRELILEAAGVYANSGGDMALLIADNRQRISALETQLRADPRNQALMSQLDARQTLKRRFDAPDPTPVPVPPEVVVPARIEPLVRGTGELILSAEEAGHLRSLVATREKLSTLSRIPGDEQLFSVVNKVIAEHFDGHGWPDVAKILGRQAGKIPPDQELRMLQALKENFFNAQVTTRGATRTLAQEYRDRAWGGNYAHFERVERNLNDRIRALGGTP